MKIDFSRFLPVFSQRRDLVDQLSFQDAYLMAQRDKALVALSDPADLTAFIDALHKIQRFYFAAELGILEHPQIIAALKDQKNFPSWAGYATLDVDATEKQKLAKQLYEGYAGLGPIVVFIGDYTRGVGELVIEHCFENNDIFDIWIVDPLFERRIMHVVDDEGVVDFASLMARRYEGTKRRIGARSEFPSIPYADEQPTQEREALRQDNFMKFMNENGQWAAQKFTGTFLPSHQDAERDGFTFEEYIDTFFAMCNIDIEKIDAAHKVLIAILNKGEEVHITNNDGTNIRFGIKGMTFLNSLTEANIPGTEVFSAPEKEKVNGIIVAKGWFNIPMAEDQVIRDITLEFKDGRIIRAEAEEGEAYLRGQIEKDEGSHYLGELAFGTNPALSRHVMNGLLVEKIGRSFHVAIGHAYDNEGDAIINNGNHSIVHWDITTMLRDKDGMIAVDGEKIMEDGFYLDPRLAYLNGK